MRLALRPPNDAGFLRVPLRSWQCHLPTSFRSAKIFLERFFNRRDAKSRREKQSIPVSAFLRASAVPSDAAVWLRPAALGLRVKRKGPVAIAAAVWPDAFFHRRDAKSAEERGFPHPPRRGRGVERGNRTGHPLQIPRCGWGQPRADIGRVPTGAGVVEWEEWSVVFKLFCFLVGDGGRRAFSSRYASRRSAIDLLTEGNPPPAAGSSEPAAPCPEGMGSYLLPQNFCAEVADHFQKSFGPGGRHEFHGFARRGDGGKAGSGLSSVQPRMDTNQPSAAEPPPRGQKNWRERTKLSS